MIFFACIYVHMGDLGLGSHLKNLVESVQNLTPEKSQGGHKA